MVITPEDKIQPGDWIYLLPPGVAHDTAENWATYREELRGIAFQVLCIHEKPSQQHGDTYFQEFEVYWKRLSTAARRSLAPLVELQWETRRFPPWAIRKWNGLETVFAILEELEEARESLALLSSNEVGTTSDIVP